MSWGSRGKYWNVGMSEPGRQAATDRQLRALWLLSDRTIDFRGKGLTREEASDMIERAKMEKERLRREGGGTPMRPAMFAAAYSKAIAAANAAGDEWFSEHPKPLYCIYDPGSGRSVDVHDRIGEVFIKWPHQRTAFGRWLKENKFDGQYTYMPLPHRYVGRPEYGLQKAVAKAAVQALESSGVHGLKLHDHDVWG